MHHRLPALVAVALSLIIGLVILGAVPQQDIPPFPTVYLGNVLIQEQPAPEGISLVACVGGCESWESEPVLTLENGRYIGLTVRAPSSLLRRGNYLLDSGAGVRGTNPGRGDGLIRT